MIKVFLSSVSRGLEVVRQQLLNDLRIARFAVVNMESFGARAERPLDVCLSELRTADVVVVVIGPRYGSLTEGDEVSYTHEEFREAQRRGLPVLAFVLGTSRACDEVERNKLRGFAEEAGQAITYQATSKNQLSAKVLAALSAARELGKCGPSHSLFQPWEKFFRRQLKPGVGLHSWSGFIGREVELRTLTEFSVSSEPVLVISAPGGAGKSRLLLEMARMVSQSSDKSPIYLFVDAGEAWDAADIHALPLVPTILVIDDAHRRPDLDALITAALNQNPDVRFIVSCRPGALDLLRADLSDLKPLGESPPLMELKALPKEASVELAKNCLGPKFAHLADRLVQIADHNPLVITIGGRCIATQEVVPEVLDHSAEQFRNDVLDRLLKDPTLGGEDMAVQRSLLEVLSTIGPVNAEDGTIRQLCAKFLGLKPSDVARRLGELDSGGFLQRRGRLVRVTPDVLADHLLYRAAVDRVGKATGYVDEVLDAFGATCLGNILANAAELDWRAAATSKHEPVLAATWRALENELPRLNYRQRSELVAQLKRAALFAPAPVLAIVEWLCDNLEAPSDPDLEKYGIEDSPRHLLDTACGLLGFIATHPDFTTRCLPRLWRFAESDDRPTNPHPEHPRRRITELLKYDRNLDPDVQPHAMRFVIERLEDSSRAGSVPWAIESIAAVLARSGEANSATKRAFTMRSFPLAPVLGQIAERRTRVIDCLEKIALGSRLDEAVIAITRLSYLLLRPLGEYGRTVSDDEVAAWLPEAKDAARRIAHIGSEAPTAVIRYFARRTLRDKSRKHWPVLGELFGQLLTTCPPISEESFFDILVGTPREEQVGDWREQQNRLSDRCTDAARLLWETHPDSADVAAVVTQALQFLGGVISTSSMNLWTFVTSLVELRPLNGPGLARAFASGDVERAFPLVPPVLATLARREARESVVVLLREFATSPHEALRMAVADSLRFIVGGKEGNEGQLELIRLFLADSSVNVRQAAVLALAGFAEKATKPAIDLLVSIEWNDNPTIAEAVCEVLQPTYGLDPAMLENDQIDAILARVQQVSVLGSGLYGVLEFIASASMQRPRQTVEMLVGRVRECRAHRSESSSTSWTPLPYSGHGLSLPGLAKSAQYADLLRLIRDAALDDDPMIGFWIPELFHAAASDLPAAFDVLREWIKSGDPAKVTRAARLLRGFDDSLVFSHGEFVAEFLEAAAVHGDGCLKRTRSELLGVAISGTYSGTPGQPAPRHVSMKQGAEALVKQFKGRLVVVEFYEQLMKYAQESIRREVAEFEEEDD